jgi:hypothetical protein
VQKPRILVLDIETKPTLVYTFGIRDQHIGHKQIRDVAESGRSVLCVGLKFIGERGVKVLSTWEHGFEGMLAAVHEAMSEADAIVTYNGCSFDVPKLNGQFLLAGMDLPPPPTQIDIYKAVRKLGFICNKLDYIAPLLGLGGKVKHAGLEMWIDVMNGCPKAQKKMARYCAGDVRLTEEVYNKVRGYVPDHPHLNATPKEACGACGSRNIQNRGWRRTKASRIARVQCQDCGAWATGKREAA